MDIISAQNYFPLMDGHLHCFTVHFHIQQSTSYLKCIILYVVYCILTIPIFKSCLYVSIKMLGKYRQILYHCFFGRTKVKRQLNSLLKSEKHCQVIFLKRVNQKYFFISWNITILTFQSNIIYFFLIIKDEIKFWNECIKGRLKYVWIFKFLFLYTILAIISTERIMGHVSPKTALVNHANTPIWGD